MIKKRVIKLDENRFPKHFKMALVSDLHAQSPKEAIEMLRDIAPDHILLCGDIFEPLDGSCDQKNEEAFELLYESAKIAPTFYATGNHEDGGIHSGRRKWKREHKSERCYTEENMKKITDSGVKFLCDSCVLMDGMAFGGLCSGIILEGGEPNVKFLSAFAKVEAPKILLCHHPEYYPKYIRDLPIDLVVSGHAHGGQWRIFGRGVYAPGQGLFPKYTSGLYDGRLVVSKGLKKTVIPPRIFNPREIVIIQT